MPRYKLSIAYDGTHYSGWQVQPNSQSIQEILTHALRTIFHHPIPITGSGRTDSGVHAKGQIAHIDVDHEIDLDKALLSLAGVLPPDIRVWKIEKTSPDFHARYSAKGKIYHYHICTNRVIDPFVRLYRTHIPYPLNLDLLQKGTQIFIGTHNFAAFANQANSGSAAKNPVRTLRRLDLIPEDGGFRLEYEGDGFLYKMVRNITGALIALSKGKLSLPEITTILESKDRRKAPSAAPAKGLFLHEVLYY